MSKDHPVGEYTTSRLVENEWVDDWHGTYKETQDTSAHPFPNPNLPPT